MGIMAISTVVLLLTVVVLPNGPSTGSKYHVLSWAELQAAKNATLVTKNTQTVCQMLYNTNQTTFDKYGIRCVRNDFYLDKICGPNQDQFCDCICYLS